MSEAQKGLLPRSLEEWLQPVLRVSRRKSAVFLAVLAAFGLALLLLGRGSAGPTLREASPVPSAPTAAYDVQARARAGELAGILGQIAGAGRVEVRLTLAASTFNQWEQNLRRNRRTVEDRTGDGGVQITTEESEETTLALARRPDGSEAPVERTATAPAVTGAVIVAQGAADPRIKADLARAAAAFLGIGLHRIVVLPLEVQS